MNEQASEYSFLRIDGFAAEENQLCLKSYVENDFLCREEAIFKDFFNHCFMVQEETAGKVKPPSDLSQMLPHPTLRHK